MSAGERKGSRRTAANAQAHLVRAAKVVTSDEVPNKRVFRTRHWSLFLFFRILSRAEMQRTKLLVEAAKDENPTEAPGGDRWLRGAAPSALRALKLDLAYPSLGGAGVVEQARRNEEMVAAADEESVAVAFETRASADSEDAEAGVTPDSGKAGPPLDHPAQEFLDWLKRLTGTHDASAAAQPTAAAVPIPAPVQAVLDGLVEGRLSALLPAFFEFHAFLEGQVPFYAEFGKNLRSWVREPRVKGDDHRRLVRLLVDETLRQIAMGLQLSGEAVPLPAIRSEAAEKRRRVRTEKIDRTPINFAFSHSGLQALKLDPDTLNSFPEPFRQGMAARARRLGDTGASAPDRWEGEFGLRTVHGFFTAQSGFDSDDEAFWKEVRADIRAFNNPQTDEDSELRLWVNSLFRTVGLEIVQIELGQDPYDLKDGKIVSRDKRTEHFGFRDGISQPFVDLGLGDTLPGGGTPSRQGGWTPVAPGEVFLDAEDETGHGHLLPVSEELRAGSTFLVFRKLEQDVYGFRAFLDSQEPKRSDLLAAQFVGRWPDGTPLIHSPRLARNSAGATEATLNDFRYAEDPAGRKCPLGAHIRRANPRDIGGRDDVRHHRILRRGISYGGSLLGENQKDDGEPRGVLFIAANSRIDVQFEVIQAEWINRGEFLGQAGLGRCPIAGNHESHGASTFLEAGATAPVTGLPNFLLNRGGDYFFAPGIEALRLIAEGHRFEVDEDDLPFKGKSMGDTVTPELFAEERLKRYGGRILMPGPKRVIRVQPKAGSSIKAEKVAFVGRYDDVVTVLSNQVDVSGKDVDFSVWPYRTAGLRITRGEDFLIGTDQAGPTKPARRRLFRILRYGWAGLYVLMKNKHKNLRYELRAAARRSVEESLRRVAGSRRVDLVGDLAVPAAYSVLNRIFGVWGPTWLTELGPALQFSRQHVSELPTDWIAAMKGERPVDPGLTTMQIWTAIITADLIANVQAQQILQQLARQAGSEMLNHLDVQLMKARVKGKQGEPSLLQAFVLNLAEPKIRKLYPPKLSDEEYATQYFKDVAVILLEILGSTLAVVPLTFASVMTGLLTMRIDLSLLLPLLQPKDTKRVVYESERLFPNVGVRMRRCETPTPMGDQTIKRHDIVAALISAANRDVRKFDEPDLFSLDEASPWGRCPLAAAAPGGQAPKRDLDDYLLFGVKGSNKDCWGRDRVAMPILEECVRGAGRLQGLRRVAGPGGEPQKLAGVTIGLPARFARISSKPV